jgi:hypothetical protein
MGRADKVGDLARLALFSLRKTLRELQREVRKLGPKLMEPSGAPC